MDKHTPGSGRRWVKRPEGSNWGDFGADDQLGSLNHITAGCIIDAVKTVERGDAFCLSLPLDYPGGSVLAPHRHPPVIRATKRNGENYFNYSFRKEGGHFCDVGCDDTVTLSTQYSTQWDSLAHIGHEFDLMDDGAPRYCFYNGYQSNEHILDPEARGDNFAMPLGIDAFAAKPIQGRGVMIDVERHFGRGYRDLDYADIMYVLEKDAVQILPGDILCLHTGFADELLKMGRTPDPKKVHSICGALDGRDTELLAWLTSSRIAAIASDNFAVERVGLAAEGEGNAFVPLHYYCLFLRGIPLGELWHLTALAAFLRETGRSAFLLTAPPLRLPGAVGSPVTPVATV